MSKALCCPTCRTPLEWSRKERRYRHCHPSPEATALIRQGARNRRAGRHWNQNAGEIRTAPTEERRENWRTKQREHRSSADARRDA